MEVLLEPGELPLTDEFDGVCPSGKVSALKNVKFAYIFLVFQVCIMDGDSMTVVYQTVDVQGGCAGQMNADFDDAL